MGEYASTQTLVIHQWAGPQNGSGGLELVDELGVSVGFVLYIS